MKKLLICAMTLATAATMAGWADVSMIEVEGEGAKYWTRWRGPSGPGIVKSGKYTEKWSPTEGVKWRVAVPGRGHSSPIIWADHIFLTTEHEGGAKLSMLAYSRSTGKQLWETFVPTDGVEHVYPKNSRASATAATDGKLVYGSFGTHGLAAFDFNGKMVWHTPVGKLNNYTAARVLRSCTRIVSSSTRTIAAPRRPSRSSRRTTRPPASSSGKPIAPK